MSTDYYYGRFENLLEESPTGIGFYKKLVQNDFHKERKFLIFENIKDELLDTTLLFQDTNFNLDAGLYLYADFNLKISEAFNLQLDIEKEAYTWNGKTYFFNKEDDIKRLFTDLITEIQVWNQKGSGNAGQEKSDKADQNLVDGYIKECCNLIINYGNNTSDSEDSIQALIKYLYRNPDEGIIHTDYLDFLIQLFDNLCQSLLKGEYLTYGIPPKKNGSYYNNIVKKYDEIWKKNNHTQTEEHLPQDASPTNDQSEFDKFLKTTTSFIKGERNDTGLIEDILSTKLNQNINTGEKYEHPFKIYLNIDRMLHDYQIFTEKVKAYAETEKHRHYFEEEDRISIDYEKEYISCCETLFDAPIAFGNIMEYIFRLLLEMCLIDHNYIATDRNFKLLMKLHSLLAASTDSCQDTEYKLPNLLDFIKGTSLINHEHIETLKETIRLLKIKTDTLLLKMWIKTYKNEHITYTARYGNAEPPTNTFFPFLDIEKEIRGQFESNDINDRFNDLLNKKIDIKENENEFEFKDYEELFTRLICESQADYKTMFSDLERIIEKPAYEISGKNFYNIYCYNNVIYQNFICHFGRYGRYIKRLKIDIKGKRNDEYLEEIEYFLKQNNQKDMLSCAFIIKHINWLLNVLENSFINKSIPDENNFDTGFKYLRLAEVILKHFENLIASIEADTYCMNYSSFFQDCFFINKPTTEGKDKLSRFIPQKFTFNPNDKNNKNIIFISSTWQPPIDLVNLKRRYDAFLSRIKLLSTDFYHQYYQHFISLQESNLKKTRKENRQELSEKVNEITQETKKQLSDNKKETVQILGVFAAFLAIATIGMEKIGNITSLDTISLIFSICTCFGYFIILLQLITHNSNKTVTTIIIAILTSFLLYGTFFIENERTPSKEKQPEKTETTYPTTTSRMEKV